MNGDIRTSEPVNIGPPNDEVLTQIEESILIDPRILESGLSTIADRYMTMKTEDGQFLTLETTIQLPEGEDQEATVFVGYNNGTQKDYHRKVIYRKDPASGQVAEWIVFSGFPNTVISDGSDQPIESDEGRAYVRTVIEAMKESYARDVRTTAETFDMKQHLSELVEADIEATENRLALLKQQRELIGQQDGPFTRFKVNIVSSWDREKPIDEVISGTSITEVLEKATSRFKKANGRADVQARSLSVEVEVGDDQFWPIPLEVVSPLYQSLTHWDKEEEAVERAKQDIADLNRND